MKFTFKKMPFPIGSKIQIQTWHKSAKLLGWTFAIVQKEHPDGSFDIVVCDNEVVRVNDTLKISPLWDDSLKTLLAQNLSVGWALYVDDDERLMTTR